MKGKYKLKYLQSFYDDISEAESYISEVLRNPQAALRLIDDTENAILNRLSYPESFEPCHFEKKLELNYYRISVHNYSVYYVVIDDVMEVRRFIYGKRNIKI